MRESNPDDRDYYWDYCQECSRPVTLLVNGLEDRGVIDVLCEDCAFGEMKMNPPDEPA